MEKNTAELAVKKKNFFKKMITRKLFWVVAVIIVAGIIIGVKIGGKKSGIEYVTEEVKLGNLVQTVAATGAVESAHDIDLNFKTAGRLVYLKVNEGDTVKAGEVLASLDSAGLSAQVQQYRANLQSTEADLAQVQAGSAGEDINISNEKVAKAQNDLNNLKTKQDVELKTLREKALNAINNASFTASVSLATVFNYLVDSNNTANLSVSNYGVLSKVRTDYYGVEKMLQIGVEDRANANNLATAGAIIAAADDLKNVLTGLNGLLNNAYLVADGLIINSYYSTTDKTTMKAGLSTEQSTNNTSLNSLQTAESNLINSINDYTTSIQAAEDNLAIYRAELNLKKAGPRDFEVQSAEAKVAQARAQLNKAMADLADYSIWAPIDGTVTKVNYSVGEQTGLASPVIKMLSTGRFEIKVDISESDIAKIKVGDKAVIELDAFGADYPFSGTVSFIDPAQTVISDVTYYQTTVSFDEDSFNEQIKPGMTADITITTAEKNGILYIPQRAVRIKEVTLGQVADKFVEVLVGENKVAEKIVVVGLRGDGGLVEIISGLNEGEKVVTFKKQ